MKIAVGSGLTGSNEILIFEGGTSLVNCSIKIVFAD